LKEVLPSLSFFFFFFLTLVILFSLFSPPPSCGRVEKLPPSVHQVLSYPVIFLFSGTSFLGFFFFSFLLSFRWIMYPPPPSGRARRSSYWFWCTLSVFPLSHQKGQSREDKCHFLLAFFFFFSFLLLPQKFVPPFSPSPGTISGKIQSVHSPFLFLTLHEIFSFLFFLGEEGEFLVALTR